MEKGQFRKENHRCYSLRAHVVFCIKYRRKILNGAMRINLQGVMDYMSRGGHFEIEEYNSEEDHVHMIIEYKDDLPLRKILSYIKSVSAKEMWKMHADILSKEFRHQRKFWSAGMWYRSVGEGDIDAVKKYISEQGEEREDI